MRVGWGRGRRRRRRRRRRVRAQRGSNAASPAGLAAPGRARGWESPPPRPAGGFRGQMCARPHLPRGAPGHAGSAGSELLRGRRPTPGADGGAADRAPAASPRAAPGRRPALATNFAQVSCAGAAAPLPARSPRCVRPRVRRAGGPSLRLLGPGPGRGNAPSPLFAGPRCGCSRFPHSRSTGGPFLAQAATPPLPRRPEPWARAQRRARSAPRSLRTAWCWQPLVSSRLPWHWSRLWHPLPGGRRLAGRGEPLELRQKRGRTLENVGDFS
ncbi:unnamed protein product [Nyctereutes procyonoides]|uniref:(raccoon dog) hypothetical protein n=1 Tax=Nyctereutes procyonoides TaxID=34880 RepID=A0A811Z2L0_NYCPR|nr:unnamed protein product [Nyctereutes procyonoides]